MVVGAAAAAAASLACGSGTGSNLLGVGIYLSYLALFGQYFCHRYM